jgi:hypothetical protein
MKQKIYLSHYIRLFLIQFLSNERGLSENTILAYQMKEGLVKIQFWHTGMH